MADWKPNHAPPSVDNAFEVAFWFYDSALDSNEYLQPQKLHRLLFLAQGYYAVAYGGRLLFPATFVADEMGPLEPNLYAAFSAGRPAVDVIGRFPQQVEMFLESIWRRFGPHSADHLTRLTKNMQSYLAARERGNHGVISLEEVREELQQGKSTPPVQKVMRPRVMRSATGKPVSVSAWLPGVKQPEEPPPEIESEPEKQAGKKVVKAAWRQMTRGEAAGIPPKRDRR